MSDITFEAVLERKAVELGVPLKSTLWSCFQLNLDEMDLALAFLRKSNSEHGGLYKYSTASGDFTYWKHYDVRMVSYRVNGDGSEDIRYYNEAVYR